MYELTERQKTLLVLIIRDYIDTAQPVGSKRLVEHYHLDLSTATIRNEMAALTEMGYLRQPHTSAGRVPSEEGYRYFVGQMMPNAELPASRPAYHLASVLSGTSGCGSMDALSPRRCLRINRKVCPWSLRRVRTRSVSSMLN